MDVSNDGRKLRAVRYYIKNSLKFYELKSESLVKIIFLFVLAASFGSVFAPNFLKNSSVIIENALVLPISVLMKIAVSMYLYANILQLKGEEYSLSSVILLGWKRFIKIVGISIIYSIAAIIAAYVIISVPQMILFVIIGATLLYITFIFSVCYILDKGMSIKNAFITSAKMTEGYKGRIFTIFLIFYLLTVVPTVLVLGMASSKTIILFFIISFESSLISLISEKLTALLYRDIEYGKIHLEEDLKTNS